MKKKKLILLVIVVIIITIITTMLYHNNKHINNKSTENSQELIKKLAKKIDDETITIDFLTWISDNYKINTLKKIDNRLKDSAYTDDIWHEITGNSYNVLIDFYNDNNKNTTVIKNDNKLATLSFVGDVSLADNWYIMPKYDERKKGINGILSTEIIDIMTNSTLMVVNNEFTISDRGEPLSGKLYTFRASPKRLSIYEEMGVDLLTLANNHVYDFGPIAFNDMIDSLNEYNIPYIGAGKNIEEAKRPYYFIINGYKIAFINATRAEKHIMTPEATETEGGVFRCYDSSALVNLIKETKKTSDYIISLIHYGREDSHELEEVQVELSKQIIDAGSDIVIGSHAHVLQGIEFYRDKPIIYNLGDFIFNNETKDTGIFQIKLNNQGNMEYYFIPALEKDEYTTLLSDSEKERVINNMNNWSINVNIDENGKIIKKP